MSDRSEMISRLKGSKKYRAAYVRAKAHANIPSQIRALRLRRGITQEDLAREAEMKQPRISAMERPGETQFNLETLIRLAAAFNVGLIVRFASYSEMLRWENEFTQDSFDVVDLEKDTAFLQEPEEVASPVLNLAELPERYQNVSSGGLTNEALCSSPSATLGIRRNIRLEPVWSRVFPRYDSSLGQTL